jgi:hypothetical protein
LKGKVSRRLTLQGDNAAPADVTDDFHLSGPFFALGVAYAFVRKPIVLSGAFSAGVLVGKLGETRTGTVAADTPPTDRPLVNQSPIQTVTKAIPIFIPEVRVAYPFSERFQLGVGLGVLVGVSDTRPAIVQTPAAAVDPTTGKSTNAQYQGKTIGLIRTNQTATGTFVLPQVSLFARLAF